jgi:two-component system, NtrC family, sensor kinase
MRLVTKLTIALVAGTLIVLATNGYLRVRREVSVLQADRVRDHALVGRALGAAVAAVWRSDGRDEALRVVDGANEHAGIVHMRWLDAPAATDALHVDAATLDALRVGDTVTQIAATQNDKARFSYTPVTVGANRVGYVEISEPLAAERRAVRAIVGDTLRTTIALAVVCGAISIALGVWLVGRPVLALAAKARRIGGGDFAHPIHLPQRDELGMLATEINAMCDRLTAATQHAERETAARIATIEQLRHADRLMTVGQLASGVAHEMGTPLNVVSARAQTLAAGTATAEEVVKYGQIIVRASGRMSKTIGQLLAFARRKPTTMARHDLRRVAAETLDLLRPMADKSRVRLDLHGEPPEIFADIDADAIQQAFANIVVNAIHAMPDGGAVDLTVAYETRPPDDARPGRYALVRVRDGGRGIAPEHLERVFEPFFTTKDVGSGTGLGLAVTRGIVDEHRGWIDVESAIGQGSSFSIHLPAPEGP